MMCLINDFSTFSFDLIALLQAMVAQKKASLEKSTG